MSNYLGGQAGVRVGLQFFVLVEDLFFLSIVRLIKRV